jgi:PAS domain S-box-containing protein
MGGGMKAAFGPVLRLWALAALAVGFATGLARGAEPLTAAERAWLSANEPVAFVSQSSYPPFEFVDGEGRRQGLCIDLARWIAKELGFRAEFADMPFGEAQAAVLEGRADVLTSLFRSGEREGRFDFTSTTWEVPSLIFVRTERPDVSGLEDLRGKRIAMQAGDYAKEFLAREGIEYERVETETFGDAAEKVIQGEADALVGDRPIVLHYLYSQGKVDRLKSVGAPLYVGLNAMASKKGGAELAGILEKGLERARESGAFDEIGAKWLGTSYDAASARRTRWTASAAVAGFLALGVAGGLLSWVAHLRRELARRSEELREAQDPRKPILRTRPWRATWARTLLLLVFLAGLGAVANHLLKTRVALPGHYELEAREARTKLRLAMELVRQEERHLEYTARDWGIWDDTYEFAGDLNERYVEANLVWPELSDHSQIDAIVLLDAEGAVRWQGAWDPFAGRAAEIDVFEGGRLPPGPLLPGGAADSGPRTALLRTALGPMAAASSPVLPSNGQGEPRGVLVVGRFLRTDALRELVKAMGVRLELASAGASDLAAADRERLGRLEPGEVELEEQGPDELAAYGAMEDAQGRAVLLAKVRMSRGIAEQGREMARTMTLLLGAFMGVVFAGTSIWFGISYREALRRQEHVEALVEARTKALRDSEEKFLTVFSQSPTPLAVIRLSDGRLADVNKAFLAMTGYGREELVGRTEQEVGLWAQANQRQECWDALSNEGRLTAYPALIRAKDGKTCHVLWSAEVLELGGEPTVVASALDVTERVRAEAEKEKLESQLVQAQKMDAIGQLAGGVAHDFNNMLGVILGHTELALDLATPGEQIHESLKEVYGAAERSAALTRQLLGFARKQTVVPRVLDLNETVDGMLKMIARLIGEDVDLEWRPKEGLGSVKVDPSQIDQILVNLCVNARDAISGKGKISIETDETVFDEDYCATHPGAVLGTYVKLAVSDTGCGMDAETIAHIYEPFFTTKSAHQGAGLGMATVYGIVRQNNGFIDVRSEVGKGTTFVIHFPRHEAEGSERPAVAAGRRERPGHETILLVEDESALLAMTGSMLRRRGYEVLAAESPAQALELARTHAGRIHLLVSDVVMPEKNGPELAAELREAHPEMKRLFMSGHTFEFLEQRGLLEEGTYFIQKPFSVAELGKKVSEALVDPREAKV